MFPAAQRLRRDEFAAVFASGARFHHRYCTVLYRPQASLQVAVVVGKKVARKAVDRNRLRRRVYALVRRFGDARPNVLSGGFIVILKPAAMAATPQELHVAITEMFAQITNSG